MGGGRLITEATSLWLRVTWVDFLKGSVGYIVMFSRLSKYGSIENAHFA